MHGITYDEVADRIIVPAQFSQAILSFRGGATGEQAPVRVIQGPRTMLKRADKVAIDSVHKEIFVGEGGAILVFPSDAQGDVAPIRVLRGPDTQIGSGIPHIAVDPVNNVLVVDARDLLIFDRTANGNAKPLRALKGAGGRPAVYNGLIFASAESRGQDRIGVWSIEDDGAAAPRWTFGDDVYQVRQIAFDPKHKSVIVTDRLNAVFTYYLPDMFAEGTR